MLVYLYGERVVEVIMPRRKFRLIDIPWYIRKVLGIVSLFRSWPAALVDYLAPARMVSHVPVIYSLRDGTQLEGVRKSGDFGGICEIYLHKVYNFPAPVQDILLSCVNRILDIGAHKAYFSIYAARLYPNAKIDAYELVLVNVETARRNIARNGLDSRITLKEAAVSTTTGRSSIAISAIDSGRHSFEQVPGDFSEHIEVDTIALDDILAEKDCDLMKLDVEGHEMHLLKDSKLWSNVKAIVMEYHELIDGSTTLEVVLPLYRSNGYTYVVDSRFSILYAVKRYLLDECGLGYLDMTKWTGKHIWK